MAIYYIENPNGKYPSEDGSRRFDKLSGKDAYAYLQTEEGKSKRFMKANDAEDDGDIVYVEVRKKDIPAFRVDERREQYVNDCIEQSGIITISLYACENLGDYEDTISGEELIEDSSSAVEELAIHEMNLEILRAALLALSDDERKLIQALYLSKKTCSERKLAKKMKISQVAVHKRKKAILKKMKNYF